MKASELFARCLSVPYIQVGESADYAVESDGDTLYIYFECSNGANDWKRNFDFPAKPYKQMGKTKWFAHRGFLKTWKEIEPYLVKEIENTKYKRIYVTGYSHGAAVAVFCHEYVWFHRPDLRETLFGYGFGCPRVYWGLPRGSCTRRWVNFTVIRNMNDLVTHLPPAWTGFSHVGTVVEIGKKGRYSMVQAHVAENILNEMKNYEQTQCDGSFGAALNGSSLLCID